jgi:hypothetical protein
MAGGFLLFNLVFWGFGVWIGWPWFLALADVAYIAVIGETHRDLFSEFQYSRSRLSSERVRRCWALTACGAHHRHHRREVLRSVSGSPAPPNSTHTRSLNAPLRRRPPPTPPFTLPWPPLHRLGRRNA